MTSTELVYKSLVEQVTDDLLEYIDEEGSAAGGQITFDCRPDRSTMASAGKWCGKR